MYLLIDKVIDVSLLKRESPLIISLISSEFR